LARFITVFRTARLRAVFETCALYKPRSSRITPTMSPPMLAPFQASNAYEAMKTMPAARMTRRGSRASVCFPAA
jgi:hypothetical protein